MVLKILLDFKKYFFKQKAEKYIHCLFCGKDLIGSQRKFCSDKCNGLYFRHNKLSNLLSNTKLRGKYLNNENGYKDKCSARQSASKFRKLKGKCYLCRLRDAEDLHHPDYSKPDLVFPS